MKSWPLWVFVALCALTLTATVAYVPGTGNKRFLGFGLAVLFFAVLP